MEEKRLECTIRFKDDNGNFLFNRLMKIPLHLEIIDNKYVTFINYVFEKEVMIEMTLTPKWKIPYPDKMMPIAYIKRN